MTTDQHAPELAWTRGELSSQDGELSARELAWRAAVAVVVAAACAVAWVIAVQPTYTATSSVYVKSTRDDAAAVFAQGLYEQNRLQSYAALAHSTLVTGDAVERADVDLTASELSREVTVQVLPQTVIITLSVEDRDAARAGTLSVALAESLAEQGNAIETGGSADTSPATLVVLDRADTPLKATSPDVLRIVVLSVLLGCLAGLVVRLPRRLLRRRLRGSGAAGEDLT